MINIGIIGLGGIAGAHLSAFAAQPNARVVACCARHPERLSDTAVGITADPIAIPPAARVYRDYRELLRDAEIDAVDICAPTDLHAEMAVAALEAGKHVLCEKPMALTVEECDRMLAAAQAADRLLMVAHCIRFWPEYAALKDLVASGDYGRVTYACFRRLSPMPDWSSGHWMVDPARSGGGIFDLHIHDADFVTYLFGMPRKVFAAGVEDALGINQVIAEYKYDGPELILAEGGRAFPPTFPFRMTFLVHLERATIEWDAARAPLTVYPEEGEAFTPALPEGTGYRREVAHFLECIEQVVEPTVVTAWQSRETVRLLTAEIASLHAKQPVAL